MQFDPGMEYRPDWSFKAMPLGPNPIKDRERAQPFRKAMNPNTATIKSLTTQGMAVNPGNKANLGDMGPQGGAGPGGPGGPGGGPGGGKEDKSWLMLCSALTDGPYSYI